MSNSSSSSAVMTSLPVPRTRQPSTHQDARVHLEAHDVLLPAFNNLFHDKDNVIQPSRSPIPPRMLSPRIIGSSTASEPLHLIIGENNENSAEGYAIPPLGEDFLLGNEVRLPSYQPGVVNNPSCERNLPYDTPRRPQQFQDPLKRRSAEFSPVYVPTPPSFQLPTRIHQGQSPSGWSGVDSGRDIGSGHRRSSSYGNQPQLWTGIAQQQSMPCISNLPGQQHSPRRHGE